MATFNGFWHGPDLGPLRSACLRSFIAKGHAFNLYTYKHYDDIPSGVELKDASSIIPEEDILWYENANSGNKRDLGPFSDLFRFKLLNEQGGWWSDTDAICLRRDINDSLEAWCQEHRDYNDGMIGTSQLCLQKNSILSNELYRRSQEVSQLPLERRESLGPLLLGEVISDLGYSKNQNADCSLFYPYTWLEMFKLWLPEYCDEVAAKIQNSFFLPIYQSMPSYAGLSLLRLPPKGSYLYEFLNEHKGSHSLEDCRIYDAQEVRNAFKTYLQSNSTWTFPQLNDLCGARVFAEMNLKTPNPTFKQRIKRLVKGAGRQLGLGT